MIRLYFVPVVSSGSFRCPKYFPHRENPALAGLEGIRWAWRTYTREDVGMIAADVTAGQHTILNAQPDVLPIPQNLDGAIGANGDLVRARLEAAKIPGTQFSDGQTYREVLRSILNIWQIHGRLVARLGARLLDAGVNLDLRLNELPPRVRTELIDTAIEFGLDTADLRATSTIRECLIAAAQQFPDMPAKMNVPGSGEVSI